MIGKYRLGSVPAVIAMAAVICTGCGGSSGPATSAPSLPGGGSASQDSAAPAAAPSAPSACSLLMRADVLAVAATVPRDTITIDGHQHDFPSQTNECGYNQKGVYTANGMTSTLSGDSWARLTIVTGGASYAFDSAGNDAISGLGDGAYWDAGSNIVVIRKGQNVLQVSDEVPAHVSSTTELTAAYRKAAQALAARILSRM
jgi:hypothetical protein